MESTVFRQWLAEQGCRVGSHRQHGRSYRHRQVVVDCGKRSSRLTYSVRISGSMHGRSPPRLR
jgi:hypothetical protein